MEFLRKAVINYALEQERSSLAERRCSFYSDRSLPELSVGLTRGSPEARRDPDTRDRPVLLNTPSLASRWAEGEAE
jgi:hypothetical protein